jgi:hypothetical protein
LVAGLICVAEFVRQPLHRQHNPRQHGTQGNRRDDDENIAAPPPAFVSAYL